VYTIFLLMLHSLLSHGIPANCATCVASAASGYYVAGCGR